VGIEDKLMGNKKQKVKYRIIPESVFKDLIQFIDEVQFEATKTNTVESHHLINLCNYLISCLINSDSFTDEYNEFNDEDEPDYDGMYIPSEVHDWTSSSTFDDDIHSYNFPEMSDEEYEKMLSEFDRFFVGYKKAYYRDGKKGREASLKQFRKDLEADDDLTATEKFELYYDEYRKRKLNKESLSLNDLLKKLKLRKEKGGSDTH